MTQGLQLTMLMPTDTALKPDAAQSEAATAEQGSGFGAMFGDLMQVAKNGPAETKLRQLPAGVSQLSGISQALLLAAGKALSDSEAADKVTADSAEQSAELSEQGSADEALLAASILGQLALKDKVQTDKEAAANGSDADSTDSAAAGKVIAEGAADSEGDKDKAAQLADNKLTQPDKAAQSGGGAEKALSQAAETLTDKAQPGSDSLDNVRYKNRDTEHTGKKTLDSSGKPDSAIPLPPDNSAELTADAAATDDSVARLHATPADDTSAQPKTDTATSAAAANNKTKAVTGQQSADAAASAANDAAVSAANVSVTTAEKAEQPGLAEAGNKADNSAGSEKTVLKAQSEKIDSSNAGKSGSEQSAQQQSQRQSSAAQALIDSQQLPADSNLHNAAKVSTDITGRSDTLFSNSLQAAEQRQHSGPHKVAQKSPAEQLRQSLNLLQQDAAGQLRERVSLMVRQNIQVAEIRLDPAGLGQMQIKIDMQQEQASVQFVVQQPQAKEALEQQMPRLREMLQQQGIVLSDGNVQQQSQQQERQLAQRDSNGGKQHGQHDNGADDASAVPTVQVTASVSERLVDYYA